MIDKRREKRLTAQRKKAADTLDSTVPNGGTMTSELTDTELSDLPANITAKLHQIDSEIETLKRLGESSGITAALIQELQASKLVHARGPDLDPVSASRSPSANTEPGYKTRYERHVFASPSRDTRRDRRTAHELSYRMDYSSTGGRSGTIPSCASIPRPGYTSGALYSRAVSLPRPVAVGAGGDTGQSNHLASTPRMPLSSAGPRVTGPGHLRAGVGLRPGERLLYSGGMLDSVSGDRTLNTDESLLTTLAGAESQQLTHDGIASCEFYSKPLYSQMGIVVFISVILYEHSMQVYRLSLPILQTYPYEQLRSSATQPIKGLDRTRLENYLSLDEFESLFRMPLSAFQRLPEWKRFDLKKRLELL
ncbi:Dematin [Fasciola gigantica]|uniref:Dematin n=1 Tax=Fasciola gigantica TaxID=46835 RepID=A0A504Z0G5_FASGI|nr:Dematin [Fasciola gigantica]